jgi:branched-chain amino acid transport system substrate-binding protein
VADPKQGVSVANKFVGDGVKWVVGHFNSGVVMPASDVYAENGILMITPVRHQPEDHRKGPLERVPHLRPRRPAGRSRGGLHRQELQGQEDRHRPRQDDLWPGSGRRNPQGPDQAGIKDVLYEGVNTGEKDFSALSRRSRRRRGLVYWGGLHTEGGLIVRQMRDQGVKAPLMSGDGITSDEFATIGGPGVEGTLMTFPPDPRKRPRRRPWWPKFEAKKFKPEAYTLYSYAAVQILAEAAKRAKSLDPKKVAEVLHSGKAFKTVIGDISFDKKGDITRPDYTMYVWKKGADGKITYTELK